MILRTSLVLPSLLTFTCLICMIHSTSGMVVFLCREFGPNFPACGYNKNADGPKWLGSSVRYLPKISANLDELQEWILLMNGTSAESAVAKYELSGSPYKAGDYCAQFAVLYSDSCLQNTQVTCGVSFEFDSTATSVVQPSRQLHYTEGQWSLLSYEFHLKDSDIAMKPVLVGKIDHPLKYVPAQTPYIAVKYIDILEGKCPERIGTRVSLWIIIMVIFTLLTTYTFVHIAIVGMLDSHRSRKAKALALANCEDKLKSHRSPSTVSYAN